jgi:S-adenosylmethionine:tRNA-ribosyltransferase-isomerase (queuine synthetase)
MENNIDDMIIESEEENMDMIIRRENNRIDMIIEHEDEKEERDVKVFEEKENSVIVIIPSHCSRIIEEYYMKFEKPPTIYIGKRLVKDYEQLPYENSYFDDEDWGRICLFPQAKYEFMFYPK